MAVSKKGVSKEGVSKKGVLMLGISGKALACNQGLTFNI